MNNFSKLIPQSIGEKIIAVLYLVIVGGAVYLPFLEGFALTPVITFTHRFSFTITLGSDTKTLQAIIFVIPVIFVKGLLEYHKRYGITSLLKERIIWLLGALLFMDTLYTVFSSYKGTSFSILAVRILLYSIFVTASIWIRIIFDGISKDSFLRTYYAIARIFIISLGVFAILNAVVSVHQFADCSLFNQSCKAWNYIDTTFPNKLLPVGHQRFSDGVFLIRAPGFFGDVNLNGMVSLIALIIFLSLLTMNILLQSRKGHREKYEVLALSVFSAFSFVSYGLTLSRSAVLGFIPVFIFMALYFWHVVTKANMKQQILQTGWKVLFGFIIVLAFLLGAGTQIRTPGQPANGTSITDELFIYAKRAITPAADGSTQDHFRLLNTTVLIAQRTNFLGKGLGTYKYGYVEYIDSKNPNADPHSTYGTVLAEEGIPGLIVYLVFVGFAWYAAIRLFLYTRKYTARIFASQKTVSRDIHFRTMLLTFVTALSFAFPFMTVATITYYGFFLPMAWWWGSSALIKVPEEP